MSEGQSPTTGPLVESNWPKRLHDFTRFNTLMNNLQDWRNADHDDCISVHRNQAIEIIEGVKALRAVFEAIVQEVGTSTKASLIARQQIEAMKLK